MTPKCTIFTNWTGPECGKDAVSLNDYGGFQCEFHDSIVRCSHNKVGPVTPITKDEPNTNEKLEKAYQEFLKSEPEESGSYGGGTKVVIAPHNVPQNLLRRQ